MNSCICCEPDNRGPCQGKWKAGEKVKVAQMSAVKFAGIGAKSRGVPGRHQLPLEHQSFEAPSIGFIVTLYFRVRNLARCCHTPGFQMRHFLASETTETPRYLKGGR